MIKILLVTLLTLNSAFADDHKYGVNLMMLLLNKVPGLMNTLEENPEKREAFFDVIEYTSWNKMSQDMFRNDLIIIDSKGVKIREIQPGIALFRFFGPETENYFSKEYEYAKEFIGKNPNSVTAKAQESLGKGHRTFIIKVAPYEKTWGYVTVLPVKENEDGQANSVYVNFHGSKLEKDVSLKVLYMLQKNLGVKNIYTNQLINEQENLRTDIFVQYRSNYDFVKQYKYLFSDALIKQFYLDYNLDYREYDQWLRTITKDPLLFPRNEFSFPAANSIAKWKKALILAYYSTYLSEDSSFNIKQRIFAIRNNDTAYWGVSKEEFDLANVIASGKLAEHVSDVKFLTALNTLGISLKDLSVLLNNDSVLLAKVKQTGVYKDEKAWEKFYSEQMQTLTSEIEKAEVNKDNEQIEKLYSELLQLPEALWIDKYFEKLTQAASSKDYRYRSALILAMEGKEEIPNKIWSVLGDYSDTQAFCDVLKEVKVLPLDFWKRILPNIIKENKIRWWELLARQNDWPDVFRSKVADIMKTQPMILYALKGQDQLTEAEWDALSTMMDDPKVPTACLFEFIASRKELTRDIWLKLASFIKTREIRNNKASKQISKLLIEKTDIPRDVINDIMKDGNILFEFSSYELLHDLSRSKITTVSGTTVPKFLYVEGRKPSDIIFSGERQYNESKINYYSYLKDANSNLYILMYDYSMMSDDKLAELILKSTGIDAVNSIEELFTLYAKGFEENLIAPLNTMLKEGGASYYDYKTFLSTKNNKELASAYLLITEYLVRNYPALPKKFPTYDALGLRTDLGLVIGFLRGDPSFYSRSIEIDAGNVYGQAVKVLIQEDIDPYLVFKDQRIIDNLQQVAIEKKQGTEFSQLHNTSVNVKDKSYDEQYVKKVLTMGGLKDADIPSVLNYINDMIKQGRMQNADYAIQFLEAYLEDKGLKDTYDLTVQKEMVFNKKQGIKELFPDASNVSVYKASATYLNMEERTAVTYSEEEILSKGLSQLTSSLNSYEQEGIKRKDAVFLNDALFPYLFSEIDKMSVELPKIKKKDIKALTEERLITYVYGMNILAEIMKAAPMLYTAGLKYYSPVKLDYRQKEAKEKAREVVSDKATFDRTIKDYSKEKGDPDLFNLARDIKIKL